MGVIRNLVFDEDTVAVFDEGVVVVVVVFDEGVVAVVFGEGVAAAIAVPVVVVAVAAVEDWVWEEVCCPPIALIVDYVYKKKE